MGCGATPKQKYATKVEAPASPEEQTGSGVSGEKPPRKSQGPEVPPRKMLAIKAAFAAVDTDKSGRICHHELKTLLSAIGVDELSDDDRDSVLKAMDIDEGGQIEFSEFVEWVLTNDGEADAIANWSLKKGLGKVHEAAIDGDGMKIRTLLDAGEKVNARDINDVTPLHYACRTGKAEAASVLLERRADISARTSDTQRMPLHAAAEKGSTDVIEILLGARAEVNAIDGRKRTPLHWACCSSREEASAVLLKAGADVDMKSVAGYTPFAMAQDWGTFALSTLIADNGGKR